MSRSSRTAAALAAATVWIFVTAPGANAFPQPPEKKQPGTEPAVEVDREAASDSAATDSTAAASDGASAAAARDRAADVPASKERRRAEALYARGYDEAKAAADLAAAGQAKEARKRYARALGRFDEAVRLDDRYFEAWNMLGYCARQTGDLRRSFDAYDRCLALRPEYEPAHEYRGEAYLVNGEIEKARAELQWLRDRKSAQADVLESAIEAAERGKPATPAPGGSW